MQLLSVDDVARMLKLSRSKVYALKEKIGHYRFDGAVRFREEDVFAYLDRCRVNGKRERKAAPRPRLRHIQV
jgi:excisionase family DNA binding protein